jgi:hypothetical protein
VEVDLDRAELHLTHDFQGRRKLFQRNDERLRTVLRERHGFDARGFIFEKDLRFEERVLEEGDAVYVLGTAERRGDGGWELVKGDRGLLVVSDLPEETLASNIAGSGLVRTFAGVAALAGAIMLFVLRSLAVQAP